MWKNVKKEHIIKSIQNFEQFVYDYPKAKNTFLIFNGKKYPAKHIRGMAYELGNKEKIKKSEYSGGLETVKFFQKLGFETEYKNESFSKIQLPESSKVVNTQNNNLSENKIIIKRLNVVSQKNALQKVLQKKFGIIETEKKFDWLRSPEEGSKDYIYVINSLIYL